MEKTIPAVQILIAFIRFLWSTFVYEIYCLLHALATFFDTVLERTILKRGYSYETSARIGTIVWKHKFSPVSITSPRDFLCLHFARAHPDYVLRSSVSLYCVTENEAIFIETDETVNVYISDENPFLYIAQFNRSKKVIKMPLQSFQQLAENIGDSKVPVIWLSNTGRCGSTILCQVFESVPGTLVLAENDTPQNIVLLQKSNKLTESEYQNLLKSTVRVLCKPHPGTERIFIKTRAFAVCLMADLSKLFPNMKQMFMYRNCLETLSSWLAIMASVPELVVMRAFIDSETLSNIFPFFRKWLYGVLVFKSQESRHVPINMNTVSIFTYVLANYFMFARDAMSCDKAIVSIKYEDIVSETVRTCKLIFERMGLDLNDLNRAVVAFSKDSQRGSVLSRSLVGNDPRRRISAADRIKADAILTSYNLPCLGEDWTV